MSRRKKLLASILSGTCDGSISFEEMRSLLKFLGFDELIRGSHHIFTKQDVEEILNLQPKGAACKSYQVKQVRDMIVQQGLGGTSDE